jgi:hypothetical protein
MASSRVALRDEDARHKHQWPRVGGLSVSSSRQVDEKRPNRTLDAHELFTDTKWPPQLVINRRVSNRAVSPWKRASA